MSRLSTAAAGVLLLAAGVAVGLLIAGGEDSPQVNASELAASVWEGSEALAGTDAPPTCESSTPDGIGPWSCTFHTKNGEPLVADASVAEDGSFQATIGDHRVYGCCVTRHD